MLVIYKKNEDGSEYARTNAVLHTDNHFYII